MFRTLMPSGDEPRNVSEVVNNILSGKINSTGSISLASSGTSTTLTDARISRDSVVLYMPTTANASAEMDNLFTVTAVGSATLTHSAHGNADCTYKYVVLG